MGNDILQLAIIGAAHIHTPEYVRTVNARADATIVAVHDADEQRAIRTAGDAGAEARSLRGVLEDDRIEGVLVCPETARHPEIVDAILHHRKPMFVEKPLATTSRDGFDLADRIVQAGVHYRSGFFMQRLEPLRFVQASVRAGGLGRITRARFSIGVPAVLDNWFDSWTWMTDPQLAGFGGFGDIGIHATDLMLWMLGDDVVEATGSIGRIEREPRGIDHLGEGQVRFADGCIATIAASWVDPVYAIRLDLFGTMGSLHFVDGQVTARGFEPGNVPPARFPAAGDGIVAFIEELQGQRDPVTTANDPVQAAMAVAVIEACYRGSHDLRWIGIERSSGSTPWDLRD